MLKWLSGLCWASFSSCQDRVIKTHTQKNLLHVFNAQLMYFQVGKKQFWVLKQKKGHISTIPSQPLSSWASSIGSTGQASSVRFKIDIFWGVSSVKTPSAASAPGTLVTLSRKRRGRKGVIITICQKSHGVRRERQEVVKQQHRAPGQESNSQCML